MREMSRSGYIIVDEVHKRFGRLHALRGISLAVRQNEFVTLLGPSGCGKTTLLRLIGGFEPADSGTITVGGAEVAERMHGDRRTRMVFQHYALFPHMTVGENVAFGLRMRRVPPSERAERVRKALEMVRLQEKIDARPTQLSGGQQQRVALARAIITEPTVLLLDEPLAALDQQLRKGMQLELKALQRDLGITFIYVTHDQSEALTMSDRIVVMNEGRIEQIGNGEEVYDRPETRFVARFIGEANLFEIRILERNGREARVELDGIRLDLSVPSGFDAAPGDHASLMVRPENMVLGAVPADADASITGKVVQKIYLGNLVRFIVEARSGRQVMVDNAVAAPITIGDAVALGWKIAGVRWLRADPAIF